MIAIKIISPTPGPNTTEQILEIIQAHSTGITIKQISDRVQRPISMIQVCLKNLISAKQIYARQNKMGVGSIYYPRQQK
ncbi:winged helix-turn-helix transcriptional regulator [Myxosarcina sp. GI1]|uniref:winged helix-turn-helix transcriptional regulator n=1 Tax=Myxosarcina sp. GI1 TaxID=1541065 RepID=UPI0009DF4AB5|nr:winged helix-turn-helix transcriptional regulator [Myxosarcina sp. GI1]